MCGIAGEIRFDGQAASADRVQRMAERMSRRGPDAGGLLVHDNVAFGHRRLKIVDLSVHARQPMEDPGLGLGIVFNGCIYNHDELRQTLRDCGYQFFSTSDTEVILKAYDAWGEGCVERFNGMFAFAIHERDSGRVFAARDRLGIKPFYYTADAKGLRFASALPALLDGERAYDVEPRALHHYLSFHSVVPAPLTIIAGIEKLPPATTLMIEPDGKRHVRCYWEPRFCRDPGEAERSLEEWCDEVLAALRRAVQRRLTGDVPVGALLSGGLDSSLIVGLLVRGGANLKTFSVGFEDVGGESGNEFQYSDIIARKFETEHFKIEVDGRTLLEHLPDCFAAMSEPMVSHDNIGFYMLSQAVSRHVKVVQSGQGADEVFAGYHWYPPLLEPDAGVADYRRLFLDRSHEEYARVVHPRFLAEDYSRQFVEQHFAHGAADSVLDRALRLDTTIMLVDDPVKRVDNMTMAWGLEARVPFLDHELVELAARIPPELKAAEGGKYVLKEAARRVIPAEVIDRPKGYFPVPALKYLEGANLDFVRGVLTAPRARERELFQAAYLEELFEGPHEHITPLRGSKLWQVAALEYWLQAHGL